MLYFRERRKACWERRCLTRIPACECPFDDLHRIRVPRYRVCRVALNRPLRYMSERLVFTLLLVKPSLANYFRSRARNNAAGSVWTSENPESAARGCGDQSVLSAENPIQGKYIQAINCIMFISSVLWRATGQWHIRMHLSIFPRHLSEAVETNSLYSTSIPEAHKADLGVIVQSKSNPVSASGSGRRWTICAWKIEEMEHSICTRTMRASRDPLGGGVRASIMADSPPAEL
jgi:hypothetical protein